MAITTKGDSDVASVVGGPLDAGDHCPSKPHVTVLGRREVFLSWSPPVQPLGRTMKYELKQNGQVSTQSWLIRLSSFLLNLQLVLINYLGHLQWC